MHPEQLNSTVANVPGRIFALKSRISAKKIEADLLFSNITSETTEPYQMKEQLVTIRELLIKQGNHEEGLH